MVGPQFPVQKEYFDSNYVYFLAPRNGGSTTRIHWAYKPGEMELEQTKYVPIVPYDDTPENYETLANGDQGKVVKVPVTLQDIISSHWKQSIMKEKQIGLKPMRTLPMIIILEH